MSDLLSVYSGDIKYSETQVNGATTQFTGTRLGQNNNYLLDQLIALQAATANLAAQPGRVVPFSVGVSMSFGGSTQTIFTAPGAIKSVWMIAPGLNVDLFSESFNSDPVPSFFEGRSGIGLSYTNCSFPVIAPAPNYVSLNFGFIRVQISGAALQVYSNVGAFSQMQGIVWY